MPNVRSLLENYPIHAGILWNRTILDKVVCELREFMGINQENLRKAVTMSSPLVHVRQASGYFIYLSVSIR